MFISFLEEKSKKKFHTQMSYSMSISGYKLMEHTCVHTYVDDNKI